jgi:hypothetical protein
MKIPNNFHEIILKEFNEIEKLCSETDSIEDKLYYFSASYGIVNRIMNLYCDSTLVFMHQILQTTCQSLVQRLANSKVQMPTIISSAFPNEMIAALLLSFSELRLAFEKKDEDGIRKVLEKFSNLTYATTGNGYYLYLQKKLLI